MTTTPVPAANGVADFLEHRGIKPRGNEIDRGEDQACQHQSVKDQRFVSDRVPIHFDPFDFFRAVHASRVVLQLTVHT